MKKILAIALCLLLAAASAMAQPADMMGMLVNMFAQNALNHPSNEFSYDTAMYLLSGFMGQDAEAAAAQMEAAGLAVAAQGNYDKAADDYSHTSGYTLGVGEMTIRGEARNVALLTVRATGDSEWFSNFDFAGETGNDCQYAENFMAASIEIFEVALPEIQKLESPVVIVTGYSRGAACANLLGVMLNAEYDSADVYVYTFATPNTVRGELDGNENIFNIVNANDVITNMPPEMWGFTRAGVDVVLDDPAYDSALMHGMFMNVLGVCPDIDSYYNDRHAIDAPGLSEDGVTMFELMTAAAALMTGDPATAAEAQQLLAAVMSTENDFAVFMSAFTELMLGDASDDGSTLSNQHMPDVYVQLMMSQLAQ